jgi:hypothetical protein
MVVVARRLELWHRVVNLDTRTNLPWNVPLRVFKDLE